MCAYVKFSINFNFNVNYIKVVHKIRESLTHFGCRRDHLVYVNFHHVLPGSPTNAINIHFQLAQKYSGI